MVCGGAVTVTGGVNTLLGCGMFWVGDGDVGAVVVVVVVVVEGALLLPHAAASAPAAAITTAPPTPAAMRANRFDSMDSSPICPVVSPYLRLAGRYTLPAN